MSFQTGDWVQTKGYPQRKGKVLEVNSYWLGFTSEYKILWCFKKHHNWIYSKSMNRTEKTSETNLEPSSLEGWEVKSAFKRGLL